MGVSFSHGEAGWSYGGFKNFRVELAASIGIKLDDMVGFNGGVPWDTVADPIKPLLDHSDCDGELTPDECRAVAPRLRELVAGWDADDYDKVNALRLADGMMLAADANEPFKFM